jgi:hypothetical protein
MGAAGAAAYAARQGVDLPTFLEGLGPPLTPEQAGQAITGLAADPATVMTPTCSHRRASARPGDPPDGARSPGYPHPAGSSRLATSVE